MHTDTFEEDLFGNMVICFVTPPSAFDLDRFAMQGWIRTDFLSQTPLLGVFINFATFYRLFPQRSGDDQRVGADPVAEHKCQQPAAVPQPEGHFPGQG